MRGKSREESVNKWRLKYGNVKYILIEILYMQIERAKRRVCSPKSDVWPRRGAGLLKPGKSKYKIFPVTQFLLFFPLSKGGICSFQIERVLSTILGKIEKLDKQMKESKETYKNLSDGMAFLRLEVKNLSSAVYPEQPSNLFVSYHLFKNRFGELWIR